MRFSPVRSSLGAAAAAVFLLSLESTSAGPLIQAKVTKVINQVSLIDPQKGDRPAAVQDIIRNDLGIETGKKSRSELLFQDATLTRLGAETFFSFKTGTRDLTLEKGSMLLQVPKGLGGATIHTAAVTAAITGTTIMMEYIPNQYIKVLVLEGSLRLSRNGVFGDSLVLRPGKMVIMRPDARRIPDPVDVDLEHITKTSSLVNFPGAAPLPSTPLMQAAIDDQKAQLASKDLVPTNLVMGHGTNVAVVPLYTPSGVTSGVITTASAMPGVAIKASTGTLAGAAVTTAGIAVSGASNAGASVLRSAIDPINALVGNVSGSSSSTLNPTISAVNDLLGTTTGTVNTVTTSLLGTTLRTVDSLASNVLGSSASLTSTPLTSTVTGLLDNTTGTVNTVTGGLVGTTLGTVDSLASNVLGSSASLTSTPLTSTVTGLLGGTTGMVNTVTSDLLGTTTGTVTALTGNASGTSSNASTSLTSTINNLLGGATGAANSTANSAVTTSPATTVVVSSPSTSAVTSTNLVGSVTSAPTNLLGGTLTRTTTSLGSLLSGRH